MKASNHLIGLLNFTTFLLSVPILDGGIWLSSRANNTECLKFLQWPLIVIGVSIMAVSLAGFAGVCYRNTFLMWVYLFVMFLIIAALISFIIFTYAVTDKGSGRSQVNRAYKDYYLEDYSGWLEKKVADNSYWRKIASCVKDSKVCKQLGTTVNGVLENANMFYSRELNSVQAMALVLHAKTDFREVAIKGFWEMYDPEGYSLWFYDYKYNDENTVSFVTLNKVGGFLQRMDLARKYAFGKMLIVGASPPHNVKCLWLFRGPEIPEFVMQECYNMEMYEWTKVDISEESLKKQFGNLIFSTKFV